MLYFPVYMYQCGYISLQRQRKDLLSCICKALGQYLHHSKSYVSLSSCFSYYYWKVEGLFCDRRSAGLVLLELSTPGIDLTPCLSPMSDPLTFGEDHLCRSTFLPLGALWELPECCGEAPWVADCTGVLLKLCVVKDSFLFPVCHSLILCKVQ